MDGQIAVNLGNWLEEQKETFHSMLPLYRGSSRAMSA